MKKRIGIITGVFILVLVIGLILFVSLESDNASGSTNTPNLNNEQANIEKPGAPSKVDEDEKDVSERKKQELFNFIPKVYTEGVAPFDSLFMLDAAMNKIIQTNEDVDFSVANVDKMVKKMFGEKAVINKEEVSEPMVQKSLFYYSKDAQSYAVIPAGYEGIFEHQILKNATETKDAYYVYTYALIGGYSYDEDSITQDEFGDVDYDTAKVQVIVGDKDGKDLLHIFENYMYMYEDDTWVQLYENIMPVFRYTLSKKDGDYYLTEVEQINY